MNRLQYITKASFTFLTIIIFTIITTKVQAQTINPTNHIIYVDSVNTSSSTQDGSSWKNATTSLADALKWAKLNTSTWNPNGTDSLQIWVAKGTYIPKYSPEDGAAFGDSARDNSFLLIKNVKIYGGFNPATNDTTMISRDWQTNVTILCGDRGVSGDMSDNCYHIVIAAEDVDGAKLDGFTLKNGNADGSGSISVNGIQIPKNYGGGVYNQTMTPNIYVSILLTHLTIKNNLAENGAGIFNSNYIIPTLTDVIITNNVASNYGGGMYNFASSPKLIDATVSNNSAQDGGGISSVQNSSPYLNNVTITNNSASSSGGGIANFSGSTSKLNNVSIIGNSATQGGGMCNVNSASTRSTDVVINHNSAAMGGGIYNSSSNPTSINVIITNNNASSEGGGIYNLKSSTKLRNVLIANNSVVSGTTGGIYNYNCSPKLTNVTLVNNNRTTMSNTHYSDPKLYNCIIFGNIYNSPAAPGIGLSNPTYSHSLYSGAITGTNGNINTTGINPNDIFIDTAGSNYQLTPCTIATNAGSNLLYTSSEGNLLNDSDLDGNSRLIGDSIDMGAYESPTILPDTTIDSSEAPTLTALDNNATYQWIDCINGETPINGETNQSFTATTNGSYAVVLTSSAGCVDTSNCISINSLGNTKNSFDNIFRVYPNPTNGQFSVDLGNNYIDVDITITDALGQSVDYKRLQNGSHFELTINDTNGIYFVNIVSGNRNEVIKVIKQ